MRHHRLADHAGRRHHAHIAALIGCQRGFARRQIHRFERTPQRRNRLQQAAHHDILAVGHAAFQASRAIGAASEVPLARDCSEWYPARANRRIAAPSAANPISTPFTACMETMACARRPSSRESQVTCEPRPGGTSVRHHFEDAAHRVAGAIGLVHDFLHPLLRLAASTQPSRTSFFLAERDQFLPFRRAAQPGFAHADHVAQHRNAKLPEQRFGQRAHRPRAPWSPARWRVPECSERRGNCISGCRPDRRGRAAAATPACAFAARRPNPPRAAPPVQFFQSLFWMMIAMGEPMVFECRTPATISARSVSIFIRPPRP